MTFEEFIQQRSLERVGMGSYEWALIKEAWERGAQAEREACAKLCEEGVDTEHPTVEGNVMKNFGASTHLANAIRARGA